MRKLFAAQFPKAQILLRKEPGLRASNPGQPRNLSVCAKARFLVRPLRAPLYSTIVVAYTIVVAASFNLFLSFLTSVAHRNSRHQAAPLVPERSGLTAVSAVSWAGEVWNPTGPRLYQDGEARHSFRSVNCPAAPVGTQTPPALPCTGCAKRISPLSPTSEHSHPIAAFESPADTTGRHRDTTPGGHIRCAVNHDLDLQSHVGGN